MKITASRTVEFPKLKRVFTEGEEVELPEGTEGLEAILASPYIRKVGEVVRETKREEPIKSKN